MAQTADVSRYARAESAVFDLSFESFCARTRGAHPIVSGGPGRRGLAARVAGGSRGARPGHLACIFIYSFEIDLTSLRHALHVNISPRRRSFARDPAAPRSVSSVAEDIGRYTGNRLFKSSV